MSLLHLKTAFLIVLLAMQAACSQLLFYPSNQLFFTPAFIGQDYRDVSITSSTGDLLHGWWINAKGDTKGIIYFLHGNGGNISSSLPSVYWLAENGYAVFMLDYRGYGYSQGEPTIPLVIDDVRAGWRWLHEQTAVNHHPVYVIGQSMGAAMAGFAMANNDHPQKPRAIVLDSGFASYSLIAKDAAAKHWLTWPFQYPLSWTLPEGYDLMTAMPELAKRPLLIMHSKQDEIVPFHHANMLMASSNHKAELYVYEGAHIGAFKLQAHQQKLLNFLAAYR